MMLRSLNDMLSYRMQAKDGEIGKVTDFYFDDIGWIVRYVVDKTGFWLFGRQIVISTASIGRPDHKTKKVYLSASRQEISESPDIPSNLPVSRRHEKALMDYHNWTDYWGDAGSWAPLNPGPPRRSNKADVMSDITEADKILRSASEVLGYHVSAEGSSIGRVSDFIVDDESWNIRYMVIEADKAHGARKVIISPEWISWVGWKERVISVDLPKDKIQSCPAFNMTEPLGREYEELLYTHYNCTKYWNG